ncbi:TOMM precursor leader peptide-binding protein [Micromonospora sp. M12]
MSLPQDGAESLEVRPKLRHDVVFLDAPAGAYLRGPDTAFLIKGRSAFRWLTSLSPYLSGEHTLAQLTATLDQAQRQTLLTLVRALLAGASPRTPATAPRWRSRWRDSSHPDRVRRPLRRRPHRPFPALPPGPGGTRRRGATLLAAASGLLRNRCLQLDLHPDDEPSRYAEALRPEVATLRADGLAAEVRVHDGPVDPTGVDAVVYCTDRTGLPRLAELARACHRDGPLLVPVLVDDERAVVGPTVEPGRTPCWLCAQLRLTAAAPAAEAADFWRHLAVGAGPDVPAPLPEVTARMLGNAAAFELFRVLTGALAPDTGDGVLLLDRSTLESTGNGCYRIRPARCVVPWTSPVDATRRLRGRDVPTRPGVGVAERGVFTRFVDDPLEQAPLKTARLRLPGRRGPARSPPSMCTP